VVPTFCRHNHLVQNCPICSREQSIELRPVLSSSAPRAGQARESPPRSSRQRAATTRSSSAGGLRVRRLARGADDGYHSLLVPGLRSSADAERLAEELAFATGRLTQLGQAPPGLYATVAASDEEIEERTWLAFLIAYLCPLEDADPFAEISRARTSWSSGEMPLLQGIATGPRTAHDPARGTRTLEAYRAWAARAGSQAAGFSGESGWSPQRRFERVFERLALPGLHRDARYELLVSLGRLGVYELAAGVLELGGDNEPTVAAKRALGIGDPLLLERRAAELAQACAIPLDALDLGFYNWGRGERATLGADPAGDPDALARARSALGL
jgi:hypothetical protein